MPGRFRERASPRERLKFLRVPGNGLTIPLQPDWTVQPLPSPWTSSIPTWEAGRLPEVYVRRDYIGMTGPDRRQRREAPLPSLSLLLDEPAMTRDPWSRPTLDDLRAVLEAIGKSDSEHHRAAERLELSVPAEVTTLRGNTVSAMTREISRFGIGLLHRGYITPGEVTIRMASETREFVYRVRLEWCQPTEKGMFLSGGRFLDQSSRSSI